MRKQGLQSQESVIETEGGHEGADDYGGEDQFLHVGKDGLADLALGLGEQDHARGIQQRRKQQVFDAAGIQQPDGVDQGDGADDQVFLALGQGVLVGLAA